VPKLTLKFLKKQEHPFSLPWPSSRQASIRLPHKTWV